MDCGCLRAEKRARILPLRQSTQILQTTEIAAIGIEPIETYTANAKGYI